MVRGRGWDASTRRGAGRGLWLEVDGGEKKKDESYTTKGYDSD